MAGPEEANPEDRDPGLVFRDGVPASSRFDDVYFSRAGGLEEAAHVFLAGAGLPDAWAGRRAFTVAETGFGTGLNFLATWDLWRRRRPAGGILHYVSVEGFPIRRGTLAGVLAPFRAVAGLSARLIERYPRPVAGLHQVWFDDDGVCLTLAIGDVAAVLPALDARVDAWFLDGFAPSRNPAMWAPAVLDEVARLAAPGCRLATFTAAGAVRRGLQERGFAMRRRPGLGDKWQCLAGEFRPDEAASKGAAAGGEAPGGSGAGSAPRVAVIGAGVAGAALAGALRRRGIAPLWLDRRPTVAAEASGNPVGILMPRPTLDGGPAGRLSAAAFRHALAACAGLGVAVGGNGVLELAEDPAVLARHRRLAETGRLDALDGRLVDAQEASRIAGVALDRKAIWYPRAGWVSPPALVRALAGGAEATLGRAVARLERGDGGWLLADPEGATIAEVDVVIVATGAALCTLDQLAHLPVRAVRGQVSELPATATSRRLGAVLTFGGYLAPAVDGRHAAGATYDREGFDPADWPLAVTGDGHARIVAALPGLIGAWFEGSPRPAAGRRCARPRPTACRWRGRWGGRRRRAGGARAVRPGRPRVARPADRAAAGGGRGVGIAGRAEPDRARPGGSGRSGAVRGARKSERPESERRQSEKVTRLGVYTRPFVAPAARGHLRAIENRNNFSGLNSIALRRAPRSGGPRRAWWGQISKPQATAAVSRRSSPVKSRIWRRRSGPKYSSPTRTNGRGRSISWTRRL